MCKCNLRERQYISTERHLGETPFSNVMVFRRRGFHYPVSNCKSCFSPGDRLSKPYMLHVQHVQS